MAKINIANGIISSSADYGLYRGTSKIVNIQDGEFRVLGDLIAENYIVSSSVTSLSLSSLSGSTIFGNSADDTHQFTGSISATGSLTVNGGSGGHPLTLQTDTGDKGISLLNYQGTEIFQVRQEAGDAGLLYLKDGGNTKVLFTARPDNHSYINVSGGNFGIGTDSPGHSLDIVNSGNAEFELTRTSGASVFMQAQSAVGVIGTSTNHPLRIITNNGSRVTIDTSGNVGIGTDSPGQGQSTPISDVKFDVLGNQMLSDLSTTNTDQSKLFFFRSDGAVASQGVVPDGLKIGAIEWAALTSGDNNNSISSARIEVEASSAWNSASVRNADITFSTVGANTLAERLRITSAGYVGIGTDSPGQKLDVNGNINVGTGQIITPGGVNLALNPNTGLVTVGGNIQASGTGTNSIAGNLSIGDTKQLSTATFVSGITGDGFRISDDGADGVSMEIDNIMVRNTLRTHIFQKDTVKATNGILMVSDSGVISGSNGTNKVTFLNSKSATFADNTRLWYKDVREDDGTVISVQFDINGSGTDAGGSTTYSVDNIAGSLGDLTGSLGTSGGTAVRISGGSILLDASTPDSPFIDVLQSSGSGTGNGTVMRMGNLDGITSPTLGSLSGFGIWASGSAYFEGKINATKGGFIAGWDLNEDTIEKVDSNGGVKIDSTNKRIDFLSDASTTRLRVGQVDSNKFGIRGFDSNADRVFEISETRNEIAGWDITPGNIVSDNSEGSVALSSTDQALTIWTGSINGAEPKLVVGKLPINDGTVQNPYGFAVFSGAGPVTSSVNADSASVLITANKARLAGWELIPGRLSSGTVADINGNNASIALGTGATTATGTPTDGLFFVSASAQPVFYVGSTFSYVNDTLTAGGWTIGGGVISSSKETSNVPNAILSGSGVLSLGTGAHGFDTANRTFIDGPGNRMSIGTGFKYESDSLTIDGNASIGGFNIGTTQFTSAPSGQGQIILNESFIQFKANNNSTDRLNLYKITVTDETNTSDARFFPQGATGGTGDLTRFVRIRMGIGEGEGDPGYKADPADGGNVEYAYNNAFGEPLLDNADHRYPMSESFSITMLSGSANDKDYGTTLRYLVNHDVGSRKGINSGDNGEVMRIGKIATTEGDFLYNDPSGFGDGSISRIFHYGISGSIATTASFGTYYGDGSNLTGLAGGGNVSNSGTPSAGQVAVWTDSETIQGTSNFIIDSNSRLSLSNNDSGTSNTVFGKLAGASIDAGSNYNTFIGENVADASLNDAIYNSAVGYSTLSALTSGDYNTAIGSRALLRVNSGAQNTALGYYSGYGITTGNNNVHIGTLAGEGNTGASYLVGIGDDTFRVGGVTSGANGTVAVGYKALRVLTSGGKNTAIGYQAGLESTIEDFNTYIGYQSGYRTAGLDNQHNTFVGYNAGSGDWTSTLSSKNTAVGSNTMAGAMNSGLQNSALGYAALNAVTTGNNNIGIGVTAGDVITTGGSNTIIGSESDPSVNSATNQTVVGYGATGVADNSVTLGNASTTAVYMAQDSGATVYAQSISIDGSVFHEGDTDTKISFSDDQIDITVGNVKMLTLDESTNDVFVINQDGADVNFRVESSGNSNMIKVDGGNDFVGIGKGSPSVALEVAGTISGSLINSSGDVVAFNTSDERLKDNIKLIKEPIKKIKQLRGVEYQWNEKQNTYPTGSLDSGIIAQDVQKVLPQLVKQRGDGYLGVRQERLVGLLIESIKDQQDQIDDLRKQIKEMKDGSS